MNYHPEISLTTLAKLSDRELDAMADRGEISYGDIIAARVEKMQFAERTAALEAMVAAQNDVAPENESFTDAVVRQAMKFMRP